MTDVAMFSGGHHVAKIATIETTEVPQQKYESSTIFPFLIFIPKNFSFMNDSIAVML